MPDLITLLWVRAGDGAVAIWEGRHEAFSSVNLAPWTALQPRLFRFPRPGVPNYSLQLPQKAGWRSPRVKCISENPCVLRFRLSFPSLTEPSQSDGAVRPPADSGVAFCRKIDFVVENLH
jgi:hypothetical protein